MNMARFSDGPRLNVEVVQHMIEDYGLESSGSQRSQMKAEPMKA